MSNIRTTNQNFVNGVPELLILKLLDEKELYGFELVKTIKRVSEGYFTFGEGCIYPILHTLERKRLLSSRLETVNGRVRHYYHATPAGHRRLKELKHEWSRTSASIANILGAEFA